MHRELCRQKILAIKIKIAEHADRLARLSPPDAKIILLQTMLADFEKAKETFTRELEEIERTGETSFTELLLAYSQSRQRFSNL